MLDRRNFLKNAGALIASVLSGKLFYRLQETVVEEATTFVELADTPEQYYETTESLVSHVDTEGIPEDAVFVLDPVVPGALVWQSQREIYVRVVSGFDCVVPKDTILKVIDTAKGLPVVIPLVGDSEKDCVLVSVERIQEEGWAKAYGILPHGLEYSLDGSVWLEES